MFQDVDETIRAHLHADVPIDRAEVDISFERPTREWSARVVKPTLNVFLVDIRERVDFRDDSHRIQRSEDGRYRRTQGPRRIDLTYLISAWTREPADEHRILGRVLPSLYRTLQFPAAVLQGVLANSDVPVLSRVMPADHIAKPADFWGVMDNELRATLTWVVTAPLDVFAAQEGPLVTTATILTRAIDGGEPETFGRVGGIVHERGNAEAPVAGAEVSIEGSGSFAVTGADGRFVLDHVPAGTHKWRVESPGRKAVTVERAVPSPDYVFEVAPAKEK